MNKAALIEAGIDYDEGARRFSGKVELYEKYLRKLFDDPTFAELQEALAKQDYRQAFMTAHNLKGMTGNLSATVLYQAVCPLVDELRGGRPHQPLEPMLNAIAVAYARAKQAVLE
ncbi:MAG: Hpt domain-containing protein [Gemmiger sp.]|nr:Hpt domain-containing protein [Gemmiger sp.]